MTSFHEIIVQKEDGDDEQLVGKTYYKNGERVSLDDDLVDLETSKVTSVVGAPKSGFVEYLVEPGDIVKVGDVIIRIHDQFDSIGFSESLKDKEITGFVLVDKQVVSEKAAEYINKNHIDVSQIKKTFICLADVAKENFNTATDTKEGVPGDTSENSLLDLVDSNLEVRAIPLKFAKQVEVSSLSSVQAAGLVSTIFFNVDDCILPRSDNLIIQSIGSFLPLITYETARLLVKYPVLNAYYHDKKVMEYLDVNIGVALDMDNGLKVYTLKNTDKLSLEGVELGISQGVYDYFRKTLTPDQIKGSTFTITDLSGMGVDRFVPLISYKQAAILGVSSFDMKLNRFTLSLSFDHRVTEGKVASKFLSELSSKVIKYCNNFSSH